MLNTNYLDKLAIPRFIHSQWALIDLLVLT